MKRIEKIFTGAALLAVIIITAGSLWCTNTKNTNQNYTYPINKYGAFLAAQHAIFINDFESASFFANNLEDTEYPIVQNTKLLSDFLSGKLPENAKNLKDEKTAAARLIYDAYLLTQDDWQELYKRHKKDESALAAPLRIWSAVAINHITETLKFIESLSTNESWKNFVRGQIYAELGKPEKAAEYFDKVAADFMNINDYLYIMSFYNNYNMPIKAEALKANFTLRPGGMFMAQYNDIPSWDNYSGLKNALAFSLIQNVSHTQIMMYSDLSILLLRFAQIIGPGYDENNNAINYYMGQFFYTNTGDYEKYFNKVDKNSPFGAFSLLRIADKNDDINELKDLVDKNPLFVPAVNKLIAYYIQHDNQRAALKVINESLKYPDLSEIGHAFFTKSRAQIYYVFGDLDKAQSDIHDASVMLPLDSEILALQAKIWAGQNREIENAYDYAMGLVKQNPSDIFAWDTLGVVLAVREGTDSALEILSRVGDVANNCSSLFEHLGDLYVKKGDNDKALEAYNRALDLSDDGLTIAPQIEKKIRKLK